MPWIYALFLAIAGITSSCATVAPIPQPIDPTRPQNANNARINMYNNTANANLPESPLSPINNTDNFASNQVIPNNNMVANTPSQFNAPMNAGPSQTNVQFGRYKIYPKKINVYGRPNRGAHVIGWLKRNAFVQANIKGKWAELRGSGFIEAKNLFPQKKSLVAKRNSRKRTQR